MFLHAILFQLIQGLVDQKLPKFDFSPPGLPHISHPEDPQSLGCLQVHRRVGQHIRPIRICSPLSFFSIGFKLHYIYIYI